MTNRVIVINRHVPSITNTTAVNDLERGEWFLATDTKTIHWKNPSSGAIEPIAVGGTATSSAAALGGTGTQTIDARRGSLFYITPTGTVTLAVTGFPTGDNQVTSFILEITNGGAHRVNFWSGIRWEKGIVPTLSTGRTTTLGFIGYKPTGSTYTWKGSVLSYEN